MTDQPNALPGSTPANPYSNPPGAGAQDVVTQLRGIVQQLSAWVAAQAAPGSIVGNGSIAPAGVGSTTLITVINSDQNRTSITFHNPSNTVELLVCPASYTGVNFSARAGAFLLLPGDYLTLSGLVTEAWGSIAQSGSNNPLTIWTNGSK